MTDDADLLHGYASVRDEAAFAELVRRHLDVVYGVALRQCNGDATRAEDVAQRVFIELARHASRLSRHPALLGWLHTTTRFIAMKTVRDEARRRKREQESAILASADVSPPLDWEQIQPLLDDVLGKLNDRDRSAILLRCLEGRTFKDVGVQLHLTESAARSCVDRALDRLREQLRKRGIASTAAALGVALTSRATAAAPAGLAKLVTGTAMAASAESSAVVVTLLMKKLVLVAAALVMATEFATATAEVRNRAELRTLRDTAQSEFRQVEADLAKLKTVGARASNIVPPATISDAELVRLRQRIIQLKSRPPGVLDSEMRAPTNSGRATPEDFANTVVWAERTGGVDALAPYLVLLNDTPDNREAFMAHFSEAVRTRYPTPEKLILATHMADSLRDPVDAMQILNQQYDYQGTLIVKGWDRRVSGRERMDYLPMTKTPNGWGIGPLPLTEQMATQTLSLIDPKSGEAIVTPPPAINP